VNIEAIMSEQDVYILMSFCSHNYHLMYVHDTTVLSAGIIGGRMTVSMTAFLCPTNFVFS